MKQTDIRCCCAEDPCLRKKESKSLIHSNLDAIGMNMREHDRAHYVRYGLVIDL